MTWQFYDFDKAIRLDTNIALAYMSRGFRYRLFGKNENVSGFHCAKEI